MVTYSGLSLQSIQMNFKQSNHKWSVIGIFTDEHNMISYLNLEQFLVFTRKHTCDKIMFKEYLICEVYI